MVLVTVSFVWFFDLLLSTIILFLFLWEFSWLTSASCGGF